MLKKLTDYAKSPGAKAQAQELADKAKQFATDPKRKEEFESVKRKVTEKLGKDDEAPKASGYDAGAPKPDAEPGGDAGAPKPDAEPGGEKPAA